MDTHVSELHKKKEEKNRNRPTTDNNIKEVQKYGGKTRYRSHRKKFKNNISMFD